LDRELLKPNASVAIHKHSYAVVDVLPTEADVNIQMMKVQNKSETRFADIGGLDV
jgi:26S proteasome regulatory subunit T3